MNAATPDQRRELAEFFGRVMRRAVEVGANLTDQMDPAARAKPDDPESDAPKTTATIDLAHAYDLVTRSMRRSIAVAMHLAEPLASLQATHQRTAARTRILREVDEDIDLRAPDRDQAESLRAELRERIDGPDIEETILTRPLEEIIREIRRDLGLVLREGHRIGLRRTPEDLALLRDIAACPPTQTPKPEPTLPRVDRLARRNQTAEPEPETRADPERHQGQSLLEYLMRER